MRHRPILIAAAFLLTLGAMSGVLNAQMETGERGILPIDSSGTLEITGIHVDVGGPNAEAARYAGWRAAQRQGFRALWARMHKRPVSEAPRLPDPVLDGLVSSIIVEREQIPALDFGSKRHLETEDDRLTVLGDIIPVPVAEEVLSFGDLAMSVGVAAVLVNLLRRRRGPGDRGRPDRGAGPRSPVRRYLTPGPPRAAPESPPPGRRSVAGMTAAARPAGPGRRGTR